jgi:hypothetical protein
VGLRFNSKLVRSIRSSTRLPAVAPTAAVRK